MGASISMFILLMKIINKINTEEGEREKFNSVDAIIGTILKYLMA